MAPGFCELQLMEGGAMETADRRPVFRITVTIVAIALLDLLLLLLGGPANISRVAPKNPVLTLVVDGIVIAIGVAIQVWLRDKPKYKTVRLLAYAFTLAICLAVGLVIINLALVGSHGK
jgi:hypothetical protein